LYFQTNQSTDKFIYYWYSLVRSTCKHWQPN